MQNPPAPEIILQAALEITGESERAAYLDEVCAGDVDLRGEIDSLLAAHFADETFLSDMASAPWRESRTEHEGDTIGRYGLIRQIGEGGFGTVFLAEQNQPVKRQVALKVIKPGMDSKEIIARFEAERQALALMNHPHIARVLDAGTTDGGRPYFVMELVLGVPITQYSAGADLTTDQRLALFADVCAAVQHAHQKGIIHRDLKPSNILVSLHDGQPMVKVIDFGIAKAIGMDLTERTLFTQVGRMIGTPQYMSPEQAENHGLHVDTRSDIYSLGVVLYELLTGTTPLDGKQLRGIDYSEIQRLIREKTPPKPSDRLTSSETPSAVTARALRGDLDWIVLKSLEKDPARRYETAAALAEDLARFLDHQPVKARPPSMTYVTLRFVRRHRRAVIAVACLLLTLILGAVGTTVGMQRALAAKEQLLSKNAELDRQKLELLDAKQRLAGLLEANQKMLGEIRKMNTDLGTLPTEFEIVRRENQALLKRFTTEVADQQRYSQQIANLEAAKARVDQLLAEMLEENQSLKKEKQQVLAALVAQQARTSGIHPQNSQDPPIDMPLDPATGNILIPHTVISLTTGQIDETQTLGTLTLTPEQWEQVRDGSPQSPKRFTSILRITSTGRTPPPGGNYVIELSRDRMAVPHIGDAIPTLAALRHELFREAFIPLRMNERGQVILRGKKLHYPTLVQALSTPPDIARRDSEGKLITTEHNQTLPRILHLTLPAGADPKGSVYHDRLKELAAAADQIGLRHETPQP